LEDAPPSLPEPTFFPADTVPGLLQPHRTVRDAIGDLPRLGDEHLDQPIAYASEPFTEYQRLMRADAKLVTWHTARRVSAHAMNLIRQIDEGRGLRSLPTEKLPKRFRRMRTISNGALRRDCTTLYHRLAWDRPAYTITCYFRNVSAGPFVHPEDNRALTCREAARLQSFPDEFEFCGAAVPRQIGNAVPPLLAEAVGRRLVETLNSKFARAA